MPNNSHRIIVTATAICAVAVINAQQPFGLDPSFNTNITQQYISSVLPLLDGTVIVSGKFRRPEFGQLVDKTLARFDQSGNVDNTFFATGLGGGTITPWQDQFYVGTNGTARRILPNGQIDPVFAEMNLDPLFSSSSSLDYHVFPDGRVLLAGSHSVLDSAHGFYGTYRLVWFTNTGQLDTTRVHRRASAALAYIDEMPDGKFICSGPLNTYEGISVSRIFRIHPDGGLDTTFNADLMSGGFGYKFIPLGDGSILAGGYFRENNTNDTLGLMRFLPNGDLDPNYHRLRFETTIFTSSPAYVTEILQIAPDRFVVTGNFETVDGEPHSGIVMIDENGNMLDDAFTGPGCGIFNYQPVFGGQIYPRRAIAGITPTPDGNYYIYGSYHGYDDGTTNDPLQRFVSRLYGLHVGISEQEKIDFQLWPNPASDVVTVQLAHLPTNGSIVLRDPLGREVLQEAITSYYSSLSVGGLSSGLYLLEIWSNGKRVGAQRVVVE